MENLPKFIVSVKFGKFDPMPCVLQLKVGGESVLSSNSMLSGLACCNVPFCH